MDIILKLNELLKKEDFKEELFTLIEKYLYHPVPQKEETGVLKELLDTEKESFKIEKGKWYVCIENYIFCKDDEPIFEKGKLYLSENDEELTAHNGEKWPFGNAKDYFRPATEDEIPHEPKFKVGDWINYNGRILHVSNVRKKLYDFDNKVGITTINVSAIDSDAHLWTLQDAKDGDVLIATDYNDGAEVIFIFERILSDYVCSYCSLFNHKFDAHDSPTIVHSECSSLRPVTKEQRETFFKVMADAGYEWNADKKELKEIVTKWRDDEALMNGYSFNEDADIVKAENCPYEGNIVFATEAQAKSSLAMARISQIMANDERFGGVVTDEEWEDSRQDKYTIERHINKIKPTANSMIYHFLAFHTSEQRYLFLKENLDLVEDYLMIPKKENRLCLVD